MLTKEENDLLTQTGPGTPLGDMFRRYWVPALQSDELEEADGPPVQVQLLGERLVAFRDTNGRVGLLDEFCSHRGASLWYGRNEECGLRCIYHGWKYDVDGNCVDMLSEPPTSTFKSKIRHPAYVTHEAGGIVWAYMGPREKAPRPPAFQWTKFPSSQVLVKKVLQECNYLQALEGGIDTTHVGVLHRGLQKDAKSGPWGISSGAVHAKETSAVIDIEHTTYGYRYAGVRKAGESEQYVRVTQYIMPWYTYVPVLPSGAVLFHAWVPRDDQSNWAWDVHFTFEGPVDREGAVGLRGLWLDDDFRKLLNIGNKHRQDRDAMRSKSYSGIYGIMNQDQAVQESMGPVYDRTREHLGSSDKAVIATRRLLLDAVAAFRRGADPLGTDVSIPYDRICSASGTVPASQRWQDAFPIDEGLVLRPVPDRSEPPVRA